MMPLLFEKRGDLLIIRGMRISSRNLELSGQCDVVEFHQDENGVSLFGYDGKWKPIPVEYKRGTPKENNADELGGTLCAQAMCLEEMLQVCSAGRVSVLWREQTAQPRGLLRTACGKK